MKTINLKYGDTGSAFHVADDFEYTLIHPPICKPMVNSSVDYFKSDLLKSKIIKIGKKVTDISIGICINDKTRPVPYSVLVPDLLAYLNSFGIERQQITFFIANGTHIPEEIQNLTYIPDFIKNEFVIKNHDCDDRTNIHYLGTTTRGTPVYINQEFLQCDVKIAIGNIEPHHFAGYSGAVKSVAIGLAGRKTILENHKLLVKESASACNFQSNPLRQDIEEIGKMTGLDYCLNTIKDSEKNLVNVLWGDPCDVLMQAIPIVNSLFITETNGKYDVVIASAGGYPKDINLYQAQKAITNAAKITKNNGLVILVAECREGSGSLAYENYMKNFVSPEEIIQEYHNGKFDIGPHKALQFAFIQSKMKVALFSTMDPLLVKRLLIEPILSLESTINILHRSQPKLSFAIMTDAVITIPKGGIYQKNE